MNKKKKKGWAEKGTRKCNRDWLTRINRHSAPHSGRSYSWKRKLQCGVSRIFISLLRPSHPLPYSPPSAQILLAWNWTCTMSNIWPRIALKGYLSTDKGVPRFLSITRERSV